MIAKRPKIKSSYGITMADTGKFNSIVEIDGYDFKMRGRSELLILTKDGKIYLSKEKMGLCSVGRSDMYCVPGGGWDRYEMHDKAAIREAEEEAMIKTTNVQYGGYYIVEYPEPHKWVQEKIPKEDQWRGYYTEVYVGLYDGKYTGHIDDLDRNDIVKTGKFYNIKEVSKILHPVHKDALKLYVSEHLK